MSFRKHKYFKKERLVVVQVNARETSGELTLQQATDLIQQAISIQCAIGCTNMGGMVGASVSPSLLALPLD